MLFMCILYKCNRFMFGRSFDIPLYHLPYRLANWLVICHLALVVFLHLFSCPCPELIALGGEQIVPEEITVLLKLLFCDVEVCPQFWVLYSADAFSSEDSQISFCTFSLVAFGIGIPFATCVSMGIFLVNVIVYHWNHHRIPPSSHVDVFVNNFWAASTEED